MKKPLFCLFLVTTILFSACAQKEITIETVKDGRYSPQQYLDYLSKNIREIKEGKKEGLIAGILYNPSEDEMMRLLSKLFKEKVPDQELEQLLSENLKAFREMRENKTTFGILPSTVTLVGIHVPIYIFGFPHLLEIAQLDGDVENMFLHELQHIKDIYYGVILDSYRIDRKSFERKEITPEFWRALLELRAYHLELTKIFSAKLKGERKYSQSYFPIVALKYANYYFKITEIAATPFEKSVAQIQLKNYQNIVPTFVDEKRIEFELEFQGRRYKAAFVIED